MYFLSVCPCTLVQMRFVKCDRLFNVCAYLPFQARVSRIQQIEKDIQRLGACLQVTCDTFNGSN